MLKARATTLVLGIALVFLTAIGAASPARADRGVGFRHHPFFFHSLFFLHDRFFFGFRGFAFPVPYPAVTYYPPGYYAPPPYYPPPSAYPPSGYAPPPNYAPTPPPVADAAPPQAAAQGNCRKFQRTIELEGRSVIAYCTACQQPDGTWRIIP
jgi:hypothetical protein